MTDFLIRLITSKEMLPSLITKFYPYYKTSLPAHLAPFELDTVLNCCNVLNFDQRRALISLCKILYNAVCLRKGAPLKSRVKPKKYKSELSKRNAIALGYAEIVPFHYAGNSTYWNLFPLQRKHLQNILKNKLLYYSRGKKAVGFYTTSSNLSKFAQARIKDIGNALRLLAIFNVIDLEKSTKSIKINEKQKKTDNTDNNDQTFLLSVTKFGHVFITYLFTSKEEKED